MIFLTRPDLESQIFDDYIEDNTEGNDEILNSIEKSNIALVKSKLNKRFDVEAIFNASGNDRSDLIVKYLGYLVLYDLVRRNAARKIPSDVKDDYKTAMCWLNDVRNGDETPDLPLIDNSTFKEVYHGNSTDLSLYI